jgi:catalase
MVGHLAQVDRSLAVTVAKGLGIEVSGPVSAPPNRSVPADGDSADFQHRQLADPDATSPALSMATHVPGPIATRKVAILVAPAFDAKGVATLTKALATEGATASLVGPNVGPIRGDDGREYDAPFSILTTSSVLFDAMWVAGGKGASSWAQEADAVDFVREAFKHCKAVGATGSGIELLAAAKVPAGGPDDADSADEATIVGPSLSTSIAKRFVEAMAMHRLWTREPQLHLDL